MAFSASPAKFYKQTKPKRATWASLASPIPGPLSESQTCGRLPKWWWNKLKWVDVEWMWFDVCCAAKVTFWNIMPMYKWVLCIFVICVRPCVETTHVQYIRFAEAQRRRLKIVLKLWVLVTWMLQKLTSMSRFYYWYAIWKWGTG